MSKDKPRTSRVNICAPDLLVIDMAELSLRIPRAHRNPGTASRLRAFSSAELNARRREAVPGFLCARGILKLNSAMSITSKSGAQMLTRLVRGLSLLIQRSEPPPCHCEDSSPRSAHH